MPACHRASMPHGGRSRARDLRDWGQRVRPSRVSSATHSTWWVIGNASNARIAVSS